MENNNFNKEESTILKLKMPISNTICILVSLIFYLIDSLLPKIFNKWIFIIGLGVGAIFVIAQIILFFIKNEKGIKITKTCNEYYQIILIALIVVEFIFSVFIFPATVQQTSMMDTLSPGDNLIVSRTSEIKDNDIIVFEYDDTIQKANIGVKNKELLIKRVIIREGETFYYHNNKLFINGKEARDPFLVSEMNGLTLEDIVKINNKEDICLNEDGSYSLPKDWFVVFGDNRQYTFDGKTPLSIDSRSFGIVHSSQIYGVAKYRINSLFSWENLYK